MASVSLAVRAQTAWKVFRHGLPWERAPRQQKRSPMVWPAWREGHPEWQMLDLESYVNEGFNLNSLIYGAVMYKARAVTAAPLRAYQGDPDNPQLAPPDHPLSRLLARPNPYQSGGEFCSLLQVYWNLAGNVFIHYDRPSRKAPITAMRLLRPDRVFIIPEDGGIRGYLYVPEGRGIHDGVPILPEDMGHIKLPNPGDPLEGLGYGLSPISPLAQSADIDNQVTKFLKLFFERGTMLTVVLQVKEPLETDQIDRLRNRWMEIYGGAENWSQIAVLDNAAEANRLGMTFDEMGFGELDERNESRILGPFGVPPILIGTRFGLSHATYSNYKEARAAFWEDTLVPELVLHEAEHQYFLSMDDAFPAHDLSEVPALQVDIANMVDAAHKLWTMSVPANTALKAVGLSVGDVPGGAVGYVPMNMVPVAGLPLPGGQPGETVDGAPTADEEVRKAVRRPFRQKALTPVIKRRLGDMIDRVAESWERLFAAAAERVLSSDEQAIRRLIRDAPKASSVNWETIRAETTSYLQGTSVETWRRTFRPLLRGVISDQARSLEVAFGAQFDTRNLYAEKWYEDYELQFAQQVSQTTSDALSTLLQQATREGWGIDRTSRRIGDMFQQWRTGLAPPEDFEWLDDRSPTHRTAMIARTETMRASNAGSNRLYREMGADKKEWLTRIDNRTRDSHIAADGQIRPLDQPFDVGGFKLQHPHDGSLGAPASEIINCRCTVLPVLDADEDVIAPPAPPEPKPAPDPSKTITVGERYRNTRTNAEFDVIGEDGKHTIIRFDPATTKPTGGIPVPAKDMRVLTDNLMYNLRQGHLVHVPRGIKPGPIPEPAPKPVPTPAPAPKPKPAPKPAAPKPKPPATVSVEDRVINSEPDDAAFGGVVISAAKGIASVHMVPRTLSVAEVSKIDISETHFGVYESYLNMGKYVSEGIRITDKSSQREHSRSAFVHEFGHMLDQQVFGQQLGYGSKNAIELAEWRVAVRATPTFKRLLEPLSFKEQEDFRKYLITTEETFARSYEQYIATRTTDSQMRRSFNVTRSAYMGTNGYWPEDEFKPIAEAFDRLFEKMGWRVPS